MRYGSFLNIAIIRAVMAMVSVVNIFVVSFAFDLEQMGNYGVFLAVTSYATQFGSFGFNQYVLREVALTVVHERHLKFLGNQLAFLFLIFPLTLALVLALGWGDFMQNQDTPLLLLYVFLCIFNNVLENFFIASGQPIRASLGAAFRLSWVLAFWGVLTVFDGGSEVYLAVCTMILFEMLYLFVNTVQLRGALRFLTSLNKQWIFKGVRVGGRYVVIGLCVLVATSVQRLFLYDFSGKELAGAFFFLLMLFTFIPNFFEVVFFSVLLPKLVRKGEGGIALSSQIILGSSVVLVLSLILYLLLPYVLSILGKDSLMLHYDLAIFFSLYAPFYTGFRIAFNNFYALGKDRVMLFTVFFGMLIALLSAYILVGVGRLGVMGGLASLYIVIIAFCSCFYFFGIVSKGKGKGKEAYDVG